MRWRLGRSNPKKRAAPRGVDVAPTNQASSATSTTADGTDWQPSGGPSEVHETPTIVADGDNFCFATASCLSLRRRSASSARANGARLRTPDGLTSSLVSFVGGVGSQPRRQSSSAGDTHSAPSSSSPGRDNGDGAKVSCGRGDHGLVSTVSAGGNGSIDCSRNIAVATTAVGTAAASSLPTTGWAEIAQHDLLIAEVRDYLLRRGGVDHKTAAVAARMFLALILSREPALKVMQETGPIDLVSLAREHLGLSAGVSACLLDHLVDNWTTAARLIAGDADLDDSRLRYHLGGAGRVQDGGVLQGGARAFSDCLLHHAVTQTVNRVLPGTEPSAASGAEAAEAATALYTACRTWRDVAEAINATTRRASRGHRDGAARARATTTTRVSSGGVEEKDNIYPPDTSRFYSLDSPRGQYRPHLGSSNERSTAAATALTATVEGTGESREDRQQDRVSHDLRQAIRVVTSGAHNCYGQLVVLGYKEFLVRDSTWHRVGPKNARFVLARREAPNGVHIGGRGGGGGEVRTGSNRIRIVHENAVCSPLCQAGSNHTVAINPVCSTPTNDVPAENDDDGNTNGVRNNKAGSGHPSDFKTPEPRPTVMSESCGVRNPTHRRGRGGGGTSNTNSSTTTAGVGGGGGESGEHDLGEDDDDGGGGHCFSRAHRGSGRDAAAGAVAREASYRVQLLLSGQQREAADSAGVAGTSKTRAAAAALAAAAGDDGVISISCSADDSCDMYQLGRMEGGENDFAVRGPLHQSKPGGKVCGPVSRYAVRFLVDRAPPHRCRIFAGGFNSRKCLMIPKSSPKWLEENGEWDAVTPFGVRILKPEVGEWREVTVAGSMRQPRVGRLNAVGDLMPDENNELTSGTIVDVGGVQILYESVETMSRLGGVQPSRVVKLLNSRKPQCPIQLQTLRFKPWQPPPVTTPPEAAGGGSSAANGLAAIPGGGGLGGENAGGGSAAAPAMDVEDEGENTEVDDEDNEAKSLVPHVFLACGHVQGYAKQLEWGPCPMCRTPGPLVEIQFGWCPAIDREVPTVVFNPCGHAASVEVAERWSRVAMPNNAPPDAVYRPICPYCAKPLQCKNGERPYSKLIFAR